MASDQHRKRRILPALALGARRLMAALGLFVLGAALAAPWAVTTAQTDANFGPHTARYAMTTDGAITVDLGPIGDLVIPAADTLPLRLGVHVDVEEIPADAGVAASTIDELGQDASAYASLFGDIDTLVTVVRNGIIADALLRDLSAAAVFTVIAGALIRHRRAKRRAERTAAAAGTAAGRPDPADGPATWTVFGIVAVLIAIIAIPMSPAKRITPNPVFDHTPLAGSEVTGRFSHLIDEVAGLVTKYYDDNEDFYNAARTHLDEAWASRPASPRTASGTGLVPGPRGTEGRNGDGTITVLYASDIHCNTGMSRVLGRAAALSGADLYLDGGDITMTGTTAENICIDSVDQALDADLPRIYVKGNHDSADSAAHARSRGWRVLDGRPVTAAGLTFFGLPDPRRTVFPTGDVLERGETGKEFTARVGKEACAADFDTLVIHDPAQVNAAMAAGCADFALSGHWHRRIGPEPYGQGARYVSSTTGGALANALTPGPLKMPAEFSFIRYDAATREPIDVQVVTVEMDTSVRIGPWQPVPPPGPWAPQPPAGARR